MIPDAGRPAVFFSFLSWKICFRFFPLDENSSFLPKSKGETKHNKLLLTTANHELTGIVLYIYY